MINNESFLNALHRSGIHFFAGVPDSLLKHIGACITDNVESKQHVITANEGAAVALATGYHLATGHVPMVYMQNSGLGNSVNPLLTIADREVYSIPILMMIGWRGQPGVKDEPQHVKQGRVQNDLLDVMEIPREVIGPESDDYEQVIQNLVRKAQTESRPVALVVKKGTFESYFTYRKEAPSYMMTLEEALGIVVDSLDDENIVIPTAGVTSREIFDKRARDNMGHHRDFLTVGSMGHCSQIALGIAREKSDRNVFCVDGDGAVIMHMGALAIIGSQGPGNYKHIVINNGAHDSVGGQPTAGFSIDIPAIAKACGYREGRSVTVRVGLEQQLEWLKSTEGPVLLEVRVRKGVRPDLGRPTRSPVQNKNDLMKHLKQEKQLV